MKKLIRAMLLVVILSGVAIGVWGAMRRATRLDRADAHLTAAQRAAAVSQWDRAAAELEAMLKLEPESDGAWLMLADVRFRQGRLADALNHVARVPSQAANGAPARLLEGMLLLKVGQALRAEAVLKECLAIAPNSVDARRRLVFLYAIELRRDELQSVLWELSERGAAETLDLVLLSGSTFIVWNAAEIMSTVQSFASSESRDVAARTAVGRYALRQGDLATARRVLSDACRLAPDDVAPRSALVECLIDSGEFDEARRALESTTANGEHAARIAYCRARIAEELDQTDDALAAYVEATAWASRRATTTATAGRTCA